MNKKQLRAYGRGYDHGKEDGYQARKEFEDYRRKMEPVACPLAIDAAFQAGLIAGRAEAVEVEVVEEEEEEEEVEEVEARPLARLHKLVTSRPTAGKSSAAVSHGGLYVQPDLKNRGEWRRASKRVRKPLLDNTTLTMWRVEFEGRTWVYMIDDFKQGVKVRDEVSDITVFSEKKDQYNNFRMCVDKILGLLSGRGDMAFGDLSDM